MSAVTTTRNHGSAATIPAGRPDELGGYADQWERWTSTMRIVVTDQAALATAREITDAVLDDVELACSRFRSDSEVMMLAAAGGRPMRVSAVAYELIDVAVNAARLSDGAVDPTLGNALVHLGYDADLAAVRGGDEAEPRHQAQVVVLARPLRLWQRIALDPVSRTVQVPTGVLLDLGATAKAWAADRAAALIALELGTSALVSLGGDIATAGPGPQGGWQVLVRDRAEDPAAQISLPGGLALATSSTAGRRWLREGRELHHVLNPVTQAPVAEDWSSVSVAARSCVLANTYSTAGIVWGRNAPLRLQAAGVAGRFLPSGRGPGSGRASSGASGAGREIEYAGSWPREAELDRA